MKKGLFITFEGTEGSGKSTLVAKLHQALQEKGLSVYKTFEPGGTEVGTLLRKLILDDNRFSSLSSRSELLLFLASRAEHVDKVILPHLRKGDIILCDRYLDSTIAYQAYGREESPTEIEELCIKSIPLLPDYTIYLDIDIETSQKRMYLRQGESGDRIEKCDLAFHSRVLEGFALRVEKYPDRIFPVDARGSIEQVFTTVFDIVMNLVIIKGYISE